MMTVLDPLLNARSDTFLVRAYGDVLNPIHGQRKGVAWCEAVVQRLPDPVAAGDDTFSTFSKRDGPALSCRLPPMAR